MIICVATQKGGTGKTTTAAVIASAAAGRGKRTLVIDLDPQGNLSYTLGADNTGRGACELLEGSPAAEVTQEIRKDLHIIPAGVNLPTIQTSTGSARRLQAALEKIRGRYDVIVIDTPSLSGELQYNALQASTDLIIPVLADAYNIQTIIQMAGAARQIQKSNRALQLTGMIITQFDARSTVSKQMQAALVSAAGKLGIPYLGTVRAAAAVREAAALQQSVIDYAPKSKPAQDYIDIINQIL